MKSCTTMTALCLTMHLPSRLIQFLYWTMPSMSIMYINRDSTALRGRQWIPIQTVWSKHWKILCPTTSIENRRSRRVLCFFQNPIHEWEFQSRDLKLAPPESINWITFTIWSLHFKCVHAHSHAILYIYTYNTISHLEMWLWSLLCCVACATNFPVTTITATTTMWISNQNNTKRVCKACDRRCVFMDRSDRKTIQLYVLSRAGCT